MSNDVKGLLIFCEGPHDVAYVRMVLKELMNFTVKTLKFSEMPAPFNKIFEVAVKTHAGQDMALDMTHKFFLPDSLLVKEEYYIYLFNSGGKNQYGKIKQFIELLLPVYKNVKTFPEKSTTITTELKYLFLYDADAEGLNSVLKNISRELISIADNIFVSGNWYDSLKSSFGKTADDKAVYVWGESPEKGTLEDILMPMFEISDSSRIGKAVTAVESMFQWQFTGNSATDVPETERKKKAVITIAGQRAKPGSSMSVILEQSKIITATHLMADKRTLEFVEFVKDFAGIK